MVRDDIVAGLKNGLERGASIEASKQSLLNAGYAAEEVEEAAKSLNADSVLAMQQPLRSASASVPYSSGKMQQPPSRVQLQNRPFSQQPNVKKEGRGFFAENWKIISLVAVLIILIVAFVFVLLFRDTIASWFS